MNTNGKLHNLMSKVAKADEDSWLLFRCAGFFVFVVILYKLFKYFI